MDTYLNPFEFHPNSHSFPLIKPKVIQVVKLHEMVFRDAHQSLLATRMRTEDMLPIAGKLDQVGFYAMEVWGGATFDVPIRYLNEDPWDRLVALKEAMPNTPLQMLERAMNIVAYWNFPDDIVRKFMYYAKKNGCDYFRIFDALNDLRNMKVPIEAVGEVGGHAQGALSYTISPVHTIEHYVEQFKELERMGCHSLCIKDMAGMISPKKAYEIIKGCKDSGIRIPIVLHTHCTSGMTEMAYMRACDAGVDVLDTAMSPLSGGTSQPATESVVAALADTEFDTGYDLKLLIECREYFLKIWDKYRHLHRISALRPDPEVTLHQIPGGMLSNLIFQLEEQNLGDRYFDVLHETARVREELGYPPLVTPTSQVVGVQAVMNVKFGRYKTIPQETKDYCKGMYGKPPGEIKPEIMEKVLGPNWKDEVVDCRPADLLEPMFDKRKEELEKMGLVKKEEDIMTYALFPKVGLKFLKGEAKSEFSSKELPLPLTHNLAQAELKSEFKELTKDQLHDISDVVCNGFGGRKVAASIPTEYNVEVDGDFFQVKVEPVGGFITVSDGSEGDGGGQSAPPADIEGAIKSQIQGTIMGLTVKVGDTVEEGDTVATIEAMKMENPLKCDRSGEVKKIFVEEGSAVEIGAAIMQIL